MKTLVITVLVSLTFSSYASAQPLRKEIIGYYPSWKWHPTDVSVPPSALAYEKLTIVNYAFFAPRPDGSITGIDSTGDARYLRCGGDSDLVSIAHRRHVKVMLSIGGWEDSENFPAVASTDPLRRAFAHACVDAMRNFDLDGIDLDWEFPGLPDHGGTPADSHNYTLLLRTLRDSVDAYGRSIRRPCLLTAALPAGPALAGNFEMTEVARILDILNIMTYDFSGSWDPLAYHNSPLYSPAGIDSSRSVAGAFSLYHGVYGVPSEKITLGVPFYGHTFTHCSALLSPHGGADTVHFSARGAFYSAIVGVMSHCTRYWDEQAQVPYLICADWNLLISYDDAQSVRAKAGFVIDHHARGVIIWELTGDVMPDGTTPLLDVIAEEFRNVRNIDRR